MYSISKTFKFVQNIFKMAEKKKVWEQTISDDLLKAWQKLKRKKDPEVMATELQYSRPVIDRALLYGYVSMPELVEKINKFFLDRMNKEKEQARQLMGVAEQLSK